MLAFITAYPDQGISGVYRSRGEGGQATFKGHGQVAFSQRKSPGHRRRNPEKRIELKVIRNDIFKKHFCLFFSFSVSL